MAVYKEDVVKGLADTYRNIPDFERTLDLMRDGRYNEIEKLMAGRFEELISKVEREPGITYVNMLEVLRDYMMDIVKGSRAIWEKSIPGVRPGGRGRISAKKRRKLIEEIASQYKELHITKDMAIGKEKPIGLLGQLDKFVSSSSNFKGAPDSYKKMILTLNGIFFKLGKYSGWTRAWYAYKYNKMLWKSLEGLEKGFYVESDRYPVLEDLLDGSINIITLMGYVAKDYLSMKVLRKGGDPIVAILSMGGYSLCFTGLFLSIWHAISPSDVKAGPYSDAAVAIAAIIGAVIFGYFSIYSMTEK